MLKFFDEARDRLSLSCDLLVLFEMSLFDVVRFFGVALLYLGVSLRLFAPDFIFIRMHLSYVSSAEPLAEKDSSVALRF